MSSKYETASGYKLNDIVHAQIKYEAKKSKYLNFSARVCNPNTPESDAEMFVWHTVDYTEVQPGGCVCSQSMDLLAMCPMDAIDQAHEFLTNQD
jgi:hypothetical protein